MSGSRLFRSNLVVTAGTFLSRVTGVLRITALAAVLGDTPLTDAYLVANESPNIVYELLVGGVLSATLVPLFTSFREHEDKESEDVVVTTAVAAITALTIIAVAAAPLVFGVFTFDVADEVDPGLFRTVGTSLARIFLIQILFYGLVGLANAFLNSRKRFFAAAWTPILPNLIIIATLLSLPEPGGDGWTLVDVTDDTRLRLTLGLGATVGIASMALVLVPAAIRAGYRPRWRWNPRHPSARKLVTLSLWTLGFVASNIIALTVVRNLTEPGSTQSTAYIFAFIFFMLPHGLLGVSIATTFQPEMAQAVARRDKADFIRSASLGIRVTALLTIPAGVGLFVLRRPLMGLAVEYGDFSADGALLASRALGGLALGLGAFSVYLFILRCFYAHQDTRTPFVINAFENGFNVLLAFVLVGSFGVLGLGASYAIAYGLVVFWALQILGWKVPGFPIREVLWSFWKMAVAAALMGESVWFVVRNVGGNSGTDALLRVAVGTVVGVIVYGGLLLAMGSAELDVFRRRVLRRNAEPSSPAAE